MRVEKSERINVKGTNVRVRCLKTKTTLSIIIIRGGGRRRKEGIGDVLYEDTKVFVRCVDLNVAASGRFCEY